MGGNISIWIDYLNCAIISTFDTGSLVVQNERESTRVRNE